MSWLTLNQSQKTTHLIFSYIFWSIFPEKNRSDFAQALCQAGTFPSRLEAKVHVDLLRTETVLPISHPVLAWFFSVAHTPAAISKQSRGRCLKCYTHRRCSEPGHLPRRPIFKQSTPTIALTMFDLASICKEKLCAAPHCQQALSTNATLRGSQCLFF